MTNYWATYEILSNRRAIIALFDASNGGEWSGAGRVEIRNPDREALIEECYRQASLSAQGKGGRLDRFSEVKA